MNQQIKAAWEKLQAALYDTSIPRSEYIDALEDIIGTLGSDLEAARADEKRDAAPDPE